MKFLSFSFFVKLQCPFQFELLVGSLMYYHRNMTVLAQIFYRTINVKSLIFNFNYKYVIATSQNRKSVNEDEKMQTILKHLSNKLRQKI